MFKKDLRPAIQRMLDAKEPYVLDVVVPYSTHVMPFIPGEPHRGGHDLEGVVKCGALERRILVNRDGVARQHSAGRQHLSSGLFLLRCAECVNCFLLRPRAGVALPVPVRKSKLNFGNFPTNQTPAGFHSTLAGGGRPGDWKIITDEVPSAFAPLTPQPAKHRLSTGSPCSPNSARTPPTNGFPC